jgi:hypothetical protein
MVKKRRPDPTNESPAYWEQILKERGLDMDAGRDPGHRKVLRIGGSVDLERVHTARASRTGKVKPQGAGPDQ